MDAARSAPVMPHCDCFRCSHRSRVSRCSGGSPDKSAETRTAIIAAALFALSPTAIYYSTEGRMYSLLWFFTLATTGLTLKLHPRRFEALDARVVDPRCRRGIAYAITFSSSSSARSAFGC
jgi:hypothetical protein